MISLRELFLILGGLLFSVILHEVAHAWASDLQGDPTPRRAGRLTLNPLRHLDPLGTLLPILLYVSGSPVVLGWARPVPIQPAYYRRPRLGLALTGLAGPAVNLFLALAFAALFRLPLSPTWQQWCAFMVVLNLVLLFFNLLPLPPLDGSRLLQLFLPRRLLLPYLRLEPWGLPLIFLVFLFFPVIPRTLFRLTLSLAHFLLAA